MARIGGDPSTSSTNAPEAKESRIRRGGDVVRRVSQSALKAAPDVIAKTMGLTSPRDDGVGEDKRSGWQRLRDGAINGLGFGNNQQPQPMTPEQAQQMYDQQQMYAQQLAQAQAQQMYGNFQNMGQIRQTSLPNLADQHDPFAGNPQLGAMHRQNLAPFTVLPPMGQAIGTPMSNDIVGSLGGMNGLQNGMNPYGVGGGMIGMDPMMMGGGFGGGGTPTMPAGGYVALTPPMLNGMPPMQQVAENLGSVTGINFQSAVEQNQKNSMAGQIGSKLGPIGLMQAAYMGMGSGFMGGGLGFGGGGGYLGMAGGGFMPSSLPAMVSPTIC